jgi:hypothetical protein
MIAKPIFYRVNYRMVNSLFYFSSIQHFSLHEAVSTNEASQIILVYIASVNERIKFFASRPTVIC